MASLSLDQVALIVITVSFILDFITLKNPSYESSKYFGLSSIFLCMIGCTVLITVYPGILSILILIAGLYRALNVARSMFYRINKTHLLSVSLRSFWSLTFFQLLLIELILLKDYFFYYSNDHVIIAVLIVSLAWGLTALLQSLIWLKQSSTDIPSKTFLENPDLPTVSLLIPARNETSDLKQSIEYALSSDYSKLEILVLDDCSQDKTPDLIKSYAHDGVRFVSGKKNIVNWLAKNQAYQKLADEASGEILIFTGVDTRLHPKAISYGVEYMRTNKISMLSILPKRIQSSFMNQFFQPDRYWLEFIGSKFLYNKPPVLSTCWFIKKSDFDNLGQFNGLARAIAPEEYFARQLNATKQYSFLRSTDYLEISTKKSLKDQYSTAIRTRYPLLKKRPEHVYAVSMLSLVFVVGPLTIAGFGWLFLPLYIWFIALVASIALASSHILISKSTQSSMWWLSIFNFPIVMIIEIYLINLSMYRYEFSFVDWKGRNICIPIMHTTQSLPKFKD